MACKDCLNRREFLARSAMAAAALAAIEGCGDGQIGPTAVTVGSSGNLAVKLSDFPQLATTGTLVRIPNSTVAVTRTGANTFTALSTICTHEGCDTNVSANRLSCPCHDSLFSNTGAVLRGPATRALPSLNYTFDSTTQTLTISANNTPGRGRDDDKVIASD